MLTRVKPARLKLWAFFIMEIFKDIENYEGFYQISNLGRVKSLSRLVDNHSGFKKKLKEKILKNSISKTGYYVVDLKKQNTRKTFKVHRLIANAFIEKIDGKDFVNHIDGNKLNNNICNLEWCTIKENNYHAILNNLKNDFGHNHSKACFTEREIILIRNSEKSIKELSVFYGVNFSTIYRIKKGITYKKI